MSRRFRAKKACRSPLRSASKAGLIGLTKSVGKELAQEGIYVNCITPAAADTAMAKLMSAPNMPRPLWRNWR